jgi:uncharacterized membrane protein (DUF106 family)
MPTSVYSQELQMAFLKAKEEFNHNVVNKRVPEQENSLGNNLSQLIKQQWQPLRTSSVITSVIQNRQV